MSYTHLFSNRLVILGGLINRTAVKDRPWNVSQNSNVNKQRLLVVSKAAKDDGTLLEQLVIGKVDQNYVGSVVDGFLQKLQQLLL